MAPVAFACAFMAHGPFKAGKLLTSFSCPQLHLLWDMAMVAWPSKKPGLCWWPMVSHSPLQSILVDALGPWAATNLAVACSLELPAPNPGLAIPGAAMD